MTTRKKLIEVALPLEAINVASAREKSIRHGHPSTLHLWWARRPLAACRAVIFASLVDDPDDPAAPPDFVAACRQLPRGKNAAANDTPRQRLFDFIETLVQWESTTDEKVLTTARALINLATGGNPPPLLDPFAGGGSIPLEAQRLGLEAHASDLNPVAVMINKALIEIPPKFANRPPVNPRDRQKMGGADNWPGASGLAADVRYYGEWMRDRAKERIGHLYPNYVIARAQPEAIPTPNGEIASPAARNDNQTGETVIAWLWARTVKCPNPACGAQMPLVRSFDLSLKPGKEAWVEPQVDPLTRRIAFVVKHGQGGGPEGTVNNRGATCLACNTPVPFDHVRAEGKAGRMGAKLMVIVTKSSNGRNYHAPTDEHENIAFEMHPSWQPDFVMSTHPQYMSPPRYGMETFADLFTLRQLVMLTTLGDLIPEIREQVYKDALAVELSEKEISSKNNNSARAYSEAVSIYLVMVVSKATVASNTLARWRAGENKTAPAFGRQAIAMVWDYAETNPFAGAGGDIAGIVEGISDALNKLPASRIGVVTQADAVNTLIDGHYIISTDPPYYDNVPYADLSDFSYIWLRRYLKDIYPTIFGTLLVPKEAELVADHLRYGGREAANQHFESGLLDVFRKIYQYSSHDYPLSVFYAFKQSEENTDTEENNQFTNTGWETMLEGLIGSGFTIDGTWPMRTEGSSRIRNIGANALASSIVLVCRPRPDNAPVTSRQEFVKALRQELPPALRQMQSGNIAPVDLAQASIGPGMAVYSRYNKVLEPNGQRLGVRAALQLINQALDEYLVEQEGDMDADSRFAVAWFEQFGFKEGGFGQADVLARAKNTSVEGLANAGVLQAGAGKVRLLLWNELDPGWDPATDKRLTVWEAAHHLIERLNTYGEEGAARLLAQMPPDLAANARQLAYRLYSLCERKGWADHARDYNALVISWGASQEQARQFKQQLQQGRLF